jgi:hypothetical protein
MFMDLAPKERSSLRSAFKHIAAIEKKTWKTIQAALYTVRANRFGLCTPEFKKRWEEVKNPSRFGKEDTKRLSPADQELVDVMRSRTWIAAETLDKESFLDPSVADVLEKVIAEYDEMHKENLVLKDRVSTLEGEKDRLASRYQETKQELESLRHRLSHTRQGRAEKGFLQRFEK